MYDTTRLTDIVSGYIINNRQTVRAAWSSWRRPISSTAWNPMGC
jgi:hypothetical protein